MVRASAALWGLALAGLLVACPSRGPGYDVDLRLPSARADGGVVQAHLSDGTASLKLFPCDVSIRLGQCINALPIQLVFVPAGQDRSGTNECGQANARRILQEAVGGSVTLAQGAAAPPGGLWIQAFQGDDDDDSGLVDRPEMNAYSELTQGTVTVTKFDGETLEATVDARSADGVGELKGTVGAVDGDATGTPGVGPRCTWPIGAQAD